MQLSERAVYMTCTATLKCLGDHDHISISRISMGMEYVIQHAPVLLIKSHTMAGLEHTVCKTTVFTPPPPFAEGKLARSLRTGYK